MILKSDYLSRLIGGDTTQDDDPLVVTPSPDLKDLAASGAASIDLRLGTWFVSLRQARMTHLKVDEDDGEKTAQLTKKHYVPFGGNFVLHPRGFVLGVTLQWLRVPNNLSAYVVGKSSWGRRGLIIATATGVHPGFRGCLTLELSNVGEIPIVLKPGMEICQLFFHLVKAETDEMDRSQFVGLRQPALGKIKVDDVARTLAKATGEADRSP